MSNTSNAKPIPLTEIREVDYATELNNLKAEIKTLKREIRLLGMELEDRNIAHDLRERIRVFLSEIESKKRAEKKEYSDVEQDCKGCMGPCGRCEEIAK